MNASPRAVRKSRDDEEAVVPRRRRSLRAVTKRTIPNVELSTSAYGTPGAFPTSSKPTVYRRHTDRVVALAPRPESPCELNQRGYTRFVEAQVAGPNPVRRVRPRIVGRSAPCVWCGCRDRRGRISVWSERVDCLEHHPVVPCVSAGPFLGTEASATSCEVSPRNARSGEASPHCALHLDQRHPPTDERVRPERSSSAGTARRYSVR